MSKGSKNRTTDFKAYWDRYPDLTKKIKVAKIKLWDGKRIYTANTDTESLQNIFENARKEYNKKKIKKTCEAQVTIFEISEKEYNSLTVENLAEKYNKVK